MWSVGCSCEDWRCAADAHKLGRRSSFYSACTVSRRLAEDGKLTCMLLRQHLLAALFNCSMLLASHLQSPLLSAREGMLIQGSTCKI